MLQKQYKKLARNWILSKSFKKNISVYQHLKKKEQESKAIFLPSFCIIPMLFLIFVYNKLHYIISHSLIPHSIGINVTHSLIAFNLS